MPLRLRKGDVVTVRSAEEIFSTLDERGELEGLPFMPEMAALCGQSFRVEARAERICNTIAGGGTRSMKDTVFLEDLRCDGAAHGACEAQCRLYWKESWLKSGRPEPGAGSAPSPGPLLELTSALTVEVDDVEGERYRCQATQALAASTPVSIKDWRSYLREYQVGNVSLGRFILVMARAAVMEPARKLGILHAFPLRGPGPKSTKTPVLGLEPGDWIRVKRPADIAETLNDKGQNRGLSFDREMLPFCGREFQVRQKVGRLIDETNGKMIEIPSDCVTLDGAVCSGERSTCRWFCHRALYPYWREGWLERISSSAPPQA